MSKRILIVVALAAALAATVQFAAAQETAPPTTAALSPAEASLELNAIDKPNDDGRAMFVSWKELPDEAPNLIYQVLMADSTLDVKLREQIDGLEKLKVIDAARKQEILTSLNIADPEQLAFWPQDRMAARMPKEGKALAPPTPLKSDYPAVYGYAEENKHYHAVEMDRFKYTGLVFVYNPLVRDHERLAKKVKKQKLAAKLEPSQDLVTAPFIKLDEVSASPQRGATYQFKLRATRAGLVSNGLLASAAMPADNWFALHKLNLLIAMLVLSAIIMAYARIAKQDPTKLFIRRIAGMEAVDEALGRAAEMGKPVFFAHGPGGLTEVVTISALNMLGKIAERVAEFGIQMKVTCLDYLVMQVSQEMVRDGYTRVGRPDAYNDDDVFYVSHNTFAYSAAVSAMMIRENAGTAFFFGRFGSESLLLAETGAITKAIQIAGTDSFNQIPFFITTCDYTLIGEEMYAASAYLSREPRLVGAVKGQDVVKAIFMTVIVTGMVLASFGYEWFARLFWPLTN